MKSIQDQYKLVHLVLLECLVAEPSSITCDGNLEKRIDELRKSGALLRQFNCMHELRWQDQALRSSSAQNSNSPVQKSKSKNRSQDILPGKKYSITFTLQADMLYFGILKNDRLKFCIR